MEDPPIEEFYNIYNEDGTIKDKAIPFDYYRTWIIWTAEMQAAATAIINSQ